MRSLGLLCALVAFFAVACKGDIGDSCSNDGDCTGSLTCFAWPCVDDATNICSRSCEQVCATDDECPSHRRCSAQLCVEGPRVDSGPRDSMMPDGDADAGETDAGEADAGEADSGEADSGTADSGAE